MKFTTRISADKLKKIKNKDVNNKVENEKYLDIEKVVEASYTDRCKKDNVDINTIYKLYKVNELSELTEKQYANINQFWDKLKEA